MKKWWTILAAAAMVAVMTFPALAETEEIEEISLDITSEIYAGYSESPVEVSVTTDGCYIEDGDVTITNEPDEWDEDDEPKLKIIVRAEDGYKFMSGLGEEEVYLDGDGKVTDVSRSSTKVTIRVTLSPVEYSEDYYDDAEYELEVWDLEWDDANGVAYWAENSYAKRYEVRLYRDGSALTDTIKTTSESYDFSEYFTKKGDYTFRVRAVRSSSLSGSWEESEELSVTASEAVDIKSSGSSSASSGSSGTGSSGSSGTNQTSGAWLQDPIGWWWCNPDKTYPTSTWKLINGSWYYFDARGYCVMNTWIETSEIWYYCGPSGAMYTNCYTPDGYWVNHNGAWIP